MIDPAVVKRVEALLPFATWIEERFWELWTDYGDGKEIAEWPDGQLASDLTALLQAVETLQDKVEGLDADLYLAVETAYRRGATEWARLNYPAFYERLSIPNTEARGG